MEIDEREFLMLNILKNEKNNLQNLQAYNSIS